MGYQALYRTWRPKKFSDIVGQEPIVTTLVHQVETGRIAHAYLFCGSRGTGKTTTAKVLARAINCMRPLPGAQPCGECPACVQLSGENSLNVMEIDAASNNGVDEIRALRDRIVYPPSVGRYKVYIIDEVHMLSSGAFNALLKTLEEPPSHAVFILATTEPQKLPATVLSRCQRYDFKRIPAKLIVGRLRQILDATGATAEEQALGDIARASEGGMRDAISLMDMCLSYGAGHIDAALVRNVLGASDRSFLFAFADALIAGDAAALLRSIDDLVADGRDPAVFARDIVSHIRALMLAQLLGDELADLLEVAQEDAQRYREQAEGAPRERLMRTMELFMSAERDMKWAAQPRTILELCSVRACHPEREAGDSAINDRIERLEKMIEQGTIAAPKKEKPPKEEKRAEPPPFEESVEPKGKPKENNDVNHEWQKALELIGNDYKSTYPLVAQAIYKGTENDVVQIEMPKKWKMYYTVLETQAKKQLVEEALSKAYGRAVRLHVTLQGDTKKAAPANTKQNLAQAYDVFGRDKVILTDD